MHDVLVIYPDFHSADWQEFGVLRFDNVKTRTHRSYIDIVDILHTKWKKVPITHQPKNPKVIGMYYAPYIPSNLNPATLPFPKTVKI